MAKVTLKAESLALGFPPLPLWNNPRRPTGDLGRAIKPCRSCSAGRSHRKLQVTIKSVVLGGLSGVLYVIIGTANFLQEAAFLPRFQT